MFKTKNLPLAIFFNDKPKLIAQLRASKLSKRLQLKSSHGSDPILFLDACIRFSDYKTLELATKINPEFVRTSSYKPVTLACEKFNPVALMIMWPAIESSKKKSLTQTPNNWLSEHLEDLERLQNATIALEQKIRKPEKYVVAIARHYCELAEAWFNTLKSLIDEYLACTTTKMTWANRDEFSSQKTIEALSEALNHIATYRVKSQTLKHPSY